MHVYHCTVVRQVVRAVAVGGSLALRCRGRPSDNNNLSTIDD